MMNIVHAHNGHNFERSMKMEKTIQNLQNLLSLTVKKGGSDLHLVTGVIPVTRINGQITALNNDLSRLSSEAGIEILKSLLSQYQIKKLEENGDADASYEFEDPCTKKMIRCRINVYQDINGYAFALRLISNKIPSMKELLLPLSLRSLTAKQHGLIVVTGPTGSGKTTSLASMLDYINESKALHILTIEDPVEYIYPLKQSIISQREIGQNVLSFAAGLKAALREDPDVILVGEMRDAETIATALAAAETGHLVLTTLHTSNVIEAVDRMLQYFPSEQQKQIQLQLSNCFEGIIAQKLLPRADGRGRVAAFEVLLRTPATTNVIRTGEAFRLKDYMRSSEGMQTMEDSLDDLKKRMII